MDSFGQILRHLRRQSRDPLRGGLLTQERLGEMLGDVLGDAGYSGAAVSDWERDKSKINEDDRLVLLALMTVLRDCGAVQQSSQANQLLLAGNYRRLNGTEQAQLFPAEARLAPRPPEEREPRPLPPERRKQLLLLEKVKHFWVDGVLAKSVQNGVLLDVSRQRQDTAVAQPWLSVMGTDVTPLHTQTTTATVLESFHTTDRALLILGAPGSGKTTTLITLARDLIALAESRDSEPIPVILNLTSWAEQRTAVADWIIEELTTKYQIPRTLGRSWLADDMLTPLLDGLDEVPTAHQAACIKAINSYREQHGLKGIAICCRTDTYNALNTPLNLGGAIQLQPLTPDQIDNYLAVGGTPLQPLRTAICQDERLQELAHTPLTLSVMSSLYQVNSPEQGQASLMEDLDEVPHYPQHLFAVYLQRMYARRGNFRYTPAQTTQWLSWLAGQMSANNQAMFLIEKMQPSWLPNRTWRWLYIFGSRLGDSLFVGLFLWLYWLLTLQARPDFDLDWSGQLLGWLQIPIIWRDLLATLIRTFMVGFLVAVFDAFLYERRLTRAVLTKRQMWGETAVVGLIALSTATLLLYLSTWHFLTSLAFGFATGVAFMLFTFYVHGHHYQGDIRTLEALTWSWAGALKGIGIGLIITAVIELFEWRLYGPTALVRTTLMVGTAFFLLGGLSGKRVAVTNRPNHGIRLSVWNSVLVAVVLGIPVGILGTVMWHWLYGLIGGVLLALMAGTLHGGRNVANHYYLRLLLWLQKCLPWSYARFLDETADRIIMRKVGGGYIFIHRFLQDYFEQNGRSAQTTT
ncbi:MAG: hypothetical protein H6658_12915 [Ardenticatenaceae bacterium]|nr:hypothetical protein [Ardenticatenaceae bacterium]